MYETRLMYIADEFAKVNATDGYKSGGPFGAVVVRGDEILGVGYNSVIYDHDPTAHAEINAIRKACSNLKTHDLTGCELYTSCYPCPMCLSAAIWANISTIYYGNTQEDAANIGFRDDDMYEMFKTLPDNCQMINLEQHDRDITIESFKKFSETTDVTMY